MIGQAARFPCGKRLKRPCVAWVNTSEEKILSDKRENKEHLRKYFQLGFLMSCNLNVSITSSNTYELHFGQEDNLSDFEANIANPNQESTSSKPIIIMTNLSSDIPIRLDLSQRIEIKSNKETIRKFFGAPPEEEWKKPEFNFYISSLASVKGFLNSQGVKNLEEGVDNKTYMINSLPMLLLGLGEIFKGNLENEQENPKLNQLLKKILHDLPHQKALEEILPEIITSPISDLFLDLLLEDLKGLRNLLGEKIEEDGALTDFFKSLLLTYSSLPLPKQDQLAIYSKASKYIYFYFNRIQIPVESIKENSHFFNVIIALKHDLYHCLRPYINPGEEFSFLLLSQSNQILETWENIDYFESLRFPVYQKPHIFNYFYCMFWMQFFKETENSTPLEILKQTFDFNQSQTLVGGAFLSKLGEKISEVGDLKQVDQLALYLQNAWQGNAQKTLIFFVSKLFKEKIELRNEVIPYLNNLSNEDLYNPDKTTFLELLLFNVRQTFGEDQILKKEIAEDLGIPALYKLRRVYHGKMDFTCLFSQIAYNKEIGAIRLWEALKGQDKKVILAFFHDLFFLSPGLEEKILSEALKEKEIHFNFKDSLEWYLEQQEKVHFTLKVFKTLFELPDFNQEEFSDFLDALNQVFTLSLIPQLREDDLDFIENICNRLPSGKHFYNILFSLKAIPEALQTTILDKFAYPSIFLTPLETINVLKPYFRKYLAERTTSNLKLDSSAIKNWEEEDVLYFVHLLISVWIYSSDKNCKDKFSQWFDEILAQKEMSLEEGIDMLDSYIPYFEEDKSALHQFIKKLDKKKEGKIFDYLKSGGSGRFLQVFFQGENGRIDNPLFQEKLNKLDDAKKDANELEVLFRWISGFSFPQFLKFTSCFKTDEEKEQLINWADSFASTDIYFSGKNSLSNAELTSLKLAWLDTYIAQTLTFFSVEQLKGSWGNTIFEILSNYFIHAASVLKHEFPEELLEALRKELDDSKESQKEQPLREALKCLLDKDAFKKFKQDYAETKNLALLPYFYASLDDPLLNDILAESPVSFLSLPYKGGVAEDQIVKALNSYADTLLSRAEQIETLSFNRDHPFQVSFYQKILANFRKDFQACIQLLRNDFNKNLYKKLKNKPVLSEAGKNILEILKAKKEKIKKLDTSFKKIFNLKNPDSDKWVYEAYQAEEGFYRLDQLVKENQWDSSNASQEISKLLQNLFDACKINVSQKILEDPMGTASTLFNYLQKEEENAPFEHLKAILKPWVDYPEFLLAILEEEALALAFIRHPQKLKAFSEHLNQKLSFKSSYEARDFTLIKGLCNLLSQEELAAISEQDFEVFYQMIQDKFPAYFKDGIPLYCIQGLLEENFASQLFLNQPEEMLQLIRSLEFSPDEEGFHQLQQTFKALQKKSKKINPQLFFFTNLKEYPIDLLKTTIQK